MTNAWSRRSRSRSSAGGPSSGATPASRAYSLPARPGPGLADAGGRRRRRRGTPGRPRGATSSSSPTTPIWGVGCDAAAGRFVVQRDVAAGDRQAQRAAGVAEAADGLRQLPERLRPRRVAVVQAVRDAERPRAGDRDVARRLGDAHRGAQPGIGGAHARVPVGGRDEGLRRALAPAGPPRRCPRPATVAAWTVESYCSIDRPGGTRGSASPGARAARRPGSMPRSGSWSLATIGAPGAGAARRRSGGAASRSWTIASEVRAPGRDRGRAPRPSLEPARHDRDVAVVGHPPDHGARQAPARADRRDRLAGAPAARSRASAPGSR